MALIALTLTMGTSPAVANNPTTYPENPFLSGDAIFVTGTGISRYDSHTLRREWTRLPGAQTLEPVVIGDTVLVATSGSLHSLDRDTGDVLWSFASSDSVFSPVVRGGRVYIGSRDGLVRALELQNGRLLWQTRLDGWIYPPALQGDTLIVGGSAGVLYGLRTGNGETIWTTQLPQELVYRPVNAGSKLVLVTTFSGNLVAIDPRSGEVVWQTSLGTPGFSPLVSGDYIYVGGFDGRLRAHRTLNGSFVWENQAGGQLTYTRLTPDGHILTGNDEAQLSAVDRITGKTVWQTGAPGVLAGDPIQLDGKILVPMQQGRLFVTTIHSPNH